MMIMIKIACSLVRTDTAPAPCPPSFFRSASCLWEDILTGYIRPTAIRGEKIERMSLHISKKTNPPTNTHEHRNHEIYICIYACLRSFSASISWTAGAAAGGGAAAAGPVGAVGSFLSGPRSRSLSRSRSDLRSDFLRSRDLDLDRLRRRLSRRSRDLLRSRRVLQ